MANIISIPARLLRDQGLNLDGVTIEPRGRVTFRMAEDVVDLARIARVKAVRSDVLRAHREYRRQKAETSDPSGEARLLAERIVLPALKDLRLRRDLAGQLAQLAEQEAVAERRARAAGAHAAMARTAVIRHEGAVYLASTHDPSQPEIFAQAGEGSEIQASVVDTLATGAEIIFELFTGLLTLAGVSLRANIPVAKFVKRILDIIRRNRRLRRLMLRILYGGKGQGVSAFDLMTLIKELFFYGFTWECVKESLDEIVDLSFWGIVRLIFKIQTRLAPGVGQALLVADLALIAAEIGIKIARHLDIL